MSIEEMLAVFIVVSFQFLEYSAISQTYVYKRFAKNQQKKVKKN